ncbi:MAG: hypothetical protein Q4C95_06945 [Planctomycetia bacterium]|nr:hypothetical protein [Planctomycetia bacterium]
MIHVRGYLKQQQAFRLLGSRCRSLRTLYLGIINSLEYNEMRLSKSSLANDESSNKVKAFLVRVQRHFIFLNIDQKKRNIQFEGYILSNC